VGIEQLRPVARLEGAEQVAGDDALDLGGEQDHALLAQLRLEVTLLRQIAWVPQPTKREVAADEAGDERALGLS